MNTTATEQLVETFNQLSEEAQREVLEYVQSKVESKGRLVKLRIRRGTRKLTKEERAAYKKDLEDAIKANRNHDPYPPDYSEHLDEIHYGKMLTDE